MLHNQKVFVNTIIKRITEKKKGTIIKGSSRIGKDVILHGDNFIGEHSFIEKSSLGEMSYISNDCFFTNTEIGKYTSIGPRCIIAAGRHPTSAFVSTHPTFYAAKRPSGKSYVSENKYDEYKKLDPGNKYCVSIGNDVWIASNVVIVDGVRIGDGAIIASGSVVTKDIPPYAIVGGVPTKIIKYRFSPENVEWLLELKWWNHDEKWIRNNADLFEDVDKMKSAIATSNAE